MNFLFARSLKLLSVATISILSFTGCNELMDSGYSSPGRYDDRYDSRYGNSYDRRDDYYYERERERERERLRRERERLEEERRRLREEREHEHEHHRLPPPPPRDEPCPAGFQESERKCSDKERRNGCRDIRLPSGKGCVDR
jgi:hypothetical protein